MSNLDYSWIKLPRTFCVWRWYKNSNMVHLYLHLLLHASIYKEREYGEVQIRRGQILTSYSVLCRNTGLSLQTVRTCIRHLLKTRQIKMASTNRHSIITVLSFDDFQPVGIDESNPNWIKLYRKIEDWQWYKDSHMVHLFIHLLLNASNWPSENDNQALSRGQIEVSRRQICDATCISERSVRTCLKKLQSSNEIQILQKATNQESILTICKYDSYQSELLNPNIQLTYNQHATNIHADCIQFISQKATNPMSGLTVNELGSYKDDAITSNMQLTRNQHTTNTRPTCDQHATNTQLTT